jgi:hypothetical protein
MKKIRVCKRWLKMGMEMISGYWQANIMKKLWPNIWILERKCWCMRYRKRTMLMLIGRRCLGLIKWLCKWIICQRSLGPSCHQPIAVFDLTFVCGRTANQPKHSLKWIVSFRTNNLEEKLGKKQTQILTCLMRGRFTFQDFSIRKLYKIQVNHKLINIRRSKVNIGQTGRMENGRTFQEYLMMSVRCSINDKIYKEIIF